MTENERILENLKTTLCDMVEIIDFETKRDKQDVKELDNDVSKIIDLLDELEEYRAIGTVEELIKEHKELIDLSRRYLIDTNELLEYQAIGTVEELQEVKMQYDDINSVAEKTALIGLSDYGTAKEAVITEMKRNLDYSLKEYQSIGTIEEFKALKEKNEPKKPRFYAYNYYCTECGSLVGNNEFQWQRFLYCDHCGQKLDWEGGAE